MRAVTFVDALGVVDSEPVKASSLEESPDRRLEITLGQLDLRGDRPGGPALVARPHLDVPTGLDVGHQGPGDAHLPHDVARQDAVLGEHHGRAHEHGPEGGAAPHQPRHEQGLRVVAPRRRPNPSRTRGARPNRTADHQGRSLAVDVLGRGLRLGLGLRHTLGLSSGHRGGSVWIVSAAHRPSYVAAHGPKDRGGGRGLRRRTRGRRRPQPARPAPAGPGEWRARVVHMVNSGP